MSGTRVHGVTGASTSGTGVYDVVLAGAPSDASTCVAFAQVTGAAGEANAMPSGYRSRRSEHLRVRRRPVNSDFVVTVAC